MTAIKIQFGYAVSTLMKKNVKLEFLTKSASIVMDFFRVSSIMIKGYMALELTLSANDVTLATIDSQTPLLLPNIFPIDQWDLPYSNNH